MNSGSSGSSVLFKGLSGYKTEASECSPLSGLQHIVIIPCYEHFFMSILFYWHFASGYSNIIVLTLVMCSQTDVQLLSCPVTHLA